MKQLQFYQLSLGQAFALSDGGPPIYTKASPSPRPYPCPTCKGTRDNAKEDGRNWLHVCATTAVYVEAEPAPAQGGLL